MNARGSQCQPDVRNLVHTVLPFGWILTGPFPAEERHRETRLGALLERVAHSGGKWGLAHGPLSRRSLETPCRPGACPHFPGIAGRSGGKGDRHLRCAAEPVPVSSSAPATRPLCSVRQPIVRRS